MKVINVHVGILRPKNRHVISAHSPDPVNKSFKTDPIGKLSSIYDSPGPQAGTSSAGKFCNQTCLADTEQPMIENNAINAPNILRQMACGGYMNVIRNNNPMMKIINRCTKHNGQGSR